MPARTYLLDTSILSHLIRQPQGPVGVRIAKVGEDAVATSIVVACELRYGVVKRGSRRLTRQAEAILDAITILPLDAGTDRHYAAIRTTLEKKGTSIGAHDMLIAAHARSIGAICVTANVSEFKRVPALKVENWLAYRAVPID
jgi:tRNA(fMet)-specific endonuclease VapC